MSSIQFRPVVLRAREQLAEGRAKLRASHDEGSLGVQVSTCLTDLIDTVVLEIYQSAISEIDDPELESLVTLVPHGGYGRRDIAPYSDVDLMLVHRAASDDRVQPLAQRLSQDICDAGLTLGFSLRRIDEVSALAMSDATILTSIAEARYLAGSARLFTKWFEQVRRDVLGKSQALIPVIEAARLEERNKYGETVYLLTPNVKRSRGGLRDIQLVRWIGFVRYGDCDLGLLESRDVLSHQDRRSLQKAHEYLLRLRNELHFHAGRSQDVLDRDEQIRLAERYGFQEDEGLLPVEKFMREYFRHTSEVRYSSDHFGASARNRQGVGQFLHSLASHRVEGDFRVGPMSIGATRQGRKKLESDLGQVLRLMDLANLYDKWIDHPTWETIRQSMENRERVELKQEVVDRFLSLMSQPARLGHLLHRLHELGVLEQIIPGMSHARCLLQFNEFHKYTVDEHSIRTVEAATKFLSNDGPLGRAYRRLRNKRTLHLACLIHDLGKGYADDHSDVGAQLATELAERLGLPDQEGETLRFLVQKHLMLSHLAQFRDINDPAVVLELAVQVGTPEVLQMLYLLTAADLSAVGPGVLNQWKLDLFTQLYRSARRHLAGDASPDDADGESDFRRQALRDHLGDQQHDPWWEMQLAAMPDSLLFGSAPEETVEELGRLRHLDSSDAVAWSRYLPDREAVEYTVGAYEAIVPGVFHRLTGVLSSQRMEILSAEINTLADGLVLDRFYVRDKDHEGSPPDERTEDVCRRLVTALKQPTDESPRFPQLWGARTAAVAGQQHRPPSMVRIDNGTSERFTIIDVFALDRMGLLYTVTRMLFELDLSVELAKIGTHVDQVVDVFYVTDLDGKKLSDDRRLEQIQAQLHQKISDFEQT